MTYLCSLIIKCIKYVIYVTLYHLRVCQCLGGVVNYTSEVTFPGTEHRITIHQRFFGLNSFDQLIMDATVQGTTPQVPLPHTRFTLPNDNHQQYTIANGK